MFNKWIFWFGGAVLISAMVSLFFVNRASEDPVLAKKIVEQAKSGATEIPLSALTDFDWDRALVYGPYTTVDVIEDSLNVEFKGSINGLDIREDMFLLVFAKGGHAIKTAELSRAAGDYSEQDGMLTPEKDLLMIKR
ncbi:hypothetical protein HMPREF9372_3483 [Sporosarcina newyorkensis 2681]|uniref:Uncharacterized protein n=1 Tax=Sporosarcina newyorkensis 2681 TaxID=1027292 RepID=F9DXF2_9BACL|nr:hypothetical protein [Sporosarcina newyorkensis]EGQ20735.1 hypothetical protein HMPREF9372_3483 [Sporosarcina newyorkensis 2681]